MTFLSAAGAVPCPFRHHSAVGAVIFDLDGTLLDTEPMHRLAFRRTLLRLGFRTPDDLHDRLVGIATPDRIGLLRAHFGQAFPVQSFLVEYRRQKRRVQSAGIELKRGALELLGWLDQQQISSAVVTSASRNTATTCLAQTGLLQRFAVVITRDDVAHRKPHPEPFLLAAGALGVLPGTCRSLEDSTPASIPHMRRECSRSSYRTLRF
ncbi:MAG: HAD family phosphatase [Acetobacteraceae bacterium]|nr:HAD family phosphatase [Acetobacteraceae bacterium]